MAMKTIKVVNIKGTIQLDNGIDESEFYSKWGSFLKQNNFCFNGSTVIKKELISVDTSDEPELPLFD